MYVDPDATKRAPKGWTVWRTAIKWQAQRDDATPESAGAWTPMYRDPEQAIRHARRLAQEDEDGR